MNESTVLRLPLSFCSVKTTKIEVSQFLDQKEPCCSKGNFCFKLLFVEEGKGSYQIEHRKISASAGTLFLIASAKVNDIIELEAPSKYWVIACETNAAARSPNKTDIFILPPDEFLLLSFLQKFLQNQICKFSIDPKHCSEWRLRFQQLEAELQDKSFGFTEMVSMLLLQLLIDAVRLIAPQMCQNPLISHPLLPDVFCFIEENYHRQISLCDVAKAVNRSPAYLTDLVRRKTGRTVVNWIIEYRMKAARRLLLSTNYRVEQISESLGYLNTEHFIRQFRQLHGTTPRAWKIANQNY